MSRTLTINFDPDQAEIYTLIHSVRNFGESVWRNLKTTGLGEMNLGDVDAATTQLTVYRIKARNVRRLQSWIEDEMKLHHLTGTLSIESQPE
ncbi:hypothetical protein [Aestuariivirga sp.]|uniref:hypothetical protein n=1 Tax=Aestuariivirga sp. TaxID=2650926 RepID=UPI0039E6F346